MENHYLWRANNSLTFAHFSEKFSKFINQHLSSNAKDFERFNAKKGAYNYLYIRYAFSKICYFCKLEFQKPKWGRHCCTLKTKRRQISRWVTCGGLVSGTGLHVLRQKWGSSQLKLTCASTSWICSSAIAWDAEALLRCPVWRKVHSASSEHNATVIINAFNAETRKPGKTNIFQKILLVNEFRCALSLAQL